MHQQKKNNNLAQTKTNGGLKLCNWIIELESLKVVNRIK